MKIDREGHELMEVDGIDGGLEAIHLLQRQTIPLVQLSSSGGVGVHEVMFLQAEEAIGLHETMHAM